MFLFGQNHSGDGKNDYKALGKAGVTIINKMGGKQQKDPNVSSTAQKILVLYRSKQETLITSPIGTEGEQFTFDIQNETYGCFYTVGRNQQKVR